MSAAAGEAFRAPFEIDRGERVKCGVSIGAAVCPEHAEAPRNWSGTRRHCPLSREEFRAEHLQLFKAGMNELIEKRRALEIDMDAALARNEYELFLQPRVTVQTARIDSYEALIRWHHPSVA